MTTKKQSDLARDLTEPGWREREAKREAALLAAVPARRSARCPNPPAGRACGLCGGVLYCREAWREGAPTKGVAQ